MKKIFNSIVTVIFSILVFAAFTVSVSAANEQWVGSWGAAMTNMPLRTLSFDGEDITARTVITPTASGSRMRVRFSNRYGTNPIIINGANVADSKSESIDPAQHSSAIDVASISPITFNGKKQVVINPGEEIVSDPVYFEITAMKNIAISFYIQNSSDVRTMGITGGTTYLSRAGDNTSKPDFNLISSFNDADLKELFEFFPDLFDLFDISATSGNLHIIPLLSGVDVYAKEGGYTISILGDSTVSNQFPLYLAQRINDFGVHNVGISNKSIMGNTLGQNYDSLAIETSGEPLITRASKDTKTQPNVKYVIVKTGANDIISSVSNTALPGSIQPTSQQLINYYKTLCNQLHASGYKVILSTITQWKGTKRENANADPTYVRTKAEQDADWAIANEVNKWIKSSNNTYHDGYIDLATISKSPIDANAMNSSYTKDFMNPNDELQRLWADKIPFSLIGVTRKVGSIKLNASEKTINIGTSTTLKVTKILPEDAENQAYTWSSSNEDIAKVTSSGKVTGISNGTATIYCKAVDDGGTKASCKVTVVTPVEGIELNSKTLTIYTRDTATLKATILPATASNKSVTWSSSDKEVATVSSKGVVTGSKSGKAVISAKTVDGGIIASCTVTVKKRVDVSVIVTSVEKKSIYVNKTYRIGAVVYPQDATYQDLTWSSSDKSVATVDSTGLVKGIKPGSCTITVKSVDNPTVFEKITIKVYTHVDGVSINPSKYEIPLGEKTKLAPTVSPSTAYNKNVTYVSSDTSIAKVSEDGTVTAKALGNCVITITTVDGSYVAVASVKVTPVVKSTAIKLNASKKSVDVGSTYTLSPKFTPSNTTKKDVTWSTSDKSIATVSSSGVVKGISKGTATITCKAKDTGVTTTCVVTVKNVAAQSIKLTKSSYTFKPGNTYKLGVVFTPSNTTIKTVKWESSNKDIVTVSSNGTIKAIKPGTATITCTSTSGKKTATCKVTVSKILLTSIKLSNTNLTMELGSSKTLKATVSPSNATNKGLTWKSSDTSIATVSQSGVIKALKTGTVTITCTAKDGSKIVSKCKVTIVKTTVTSVKLNVSSLTMNVGKTYQLKATCSPTNAPNKKVKWTSSDNGIAKVSANGVVTAVKPGTCTIKVTSVDGNKTATCRIIVRA